MGYGLAVIPFPENVNKDNIISVIVRSCIGNSTSYNILIPSIIEIENTEIRVGYINPSSYTNTSATVTVRIIYIN